MSALCLHIHSSAIVYLRSSPASRLCIVPNEYFSRVSGQPQDFQPPAFIPNGLSTWPERKHPQAKLLVICLAFVFGPAGTVHKGPSVRVRLHIKALRTPPS